jgi:hypothetical protein
VTELTLDQWDLPGDITTVAELNNAVLKYYTVLICTYGVSFLIRVEYAPNTENEVKSYTDSSKQQTIQSPSEIKAVHTHTHTSFLQSLLMNWLA